MLVQGLQGAGEQLLRRAPLPFDSLRQEDVMGETGHRPWPPPARPWLMGQVWLDLLFAHWRVDPAQLEAVVPPQLPLDTHDGAAWIGVTPFTVAGLRLRGTAPLPGISTFPELNVRTYVTVDGKPGIYFLSLDADSRPAVFAARRSYRLPYFRARISAGMSEQGHVFESRRVAADGPPAELAIRYGPDGAPLAREDGSVERWLTERYCLYTLDADGRVLRGEIHHPPWPLRPGWAEIALNTMAAPHGIELEGDPLLHFSARQDVALWGIESVATG